MKNFLPPDNTGKDLNRSGKGYALSPQPHQKPPSPAPVVLGTGAPVPVDMADFLDDHLSYPPQRVRDMLLQAMEEGNCAWSLTRDDYTTLVLSNGQAVGQAMQTALLEHTRATVEQILSTFGQALPPALAPEAKIILERNATAVKRALTMCLQLPHDPPYENEWTLLDKALIPLDPFEAFNLEESLKQIPAQDEEGAQALLQVIQLHEDCWGEISVCLEEGYGQSYIPSYLAEGREVRLSYHPDFILTAYPTLPRQVEIALRYALNPAPDHIRNLMEQAMAEGTCPWEEKTDPRHPSVNILHIPVVPQWEGVKQAMMQAMLHRVQFQARALVKLYWEPLPDLVPASLHDEAQDFLKAMQLTLEEHLTLGSPLSPLSPKALEARNPTLLREEMERLVLPLKNNLSALEAEEASAMLHNGLISLNGALSDAHFSSRPIFALGSEDLNVRTEHSGCYRSFLKGVLRGLWILLALFLVAYLMVQ